MSVDQSNEPIVSLTWTESEYISRLKLRLAMKDVLKAYHNTNDTEHFGEDVIEIIEGWELDTLWK